MKKTVCIKEMTESQQPEYKCRLSSQNAEQLKHYATRNTHLPLINNIGSNDLQHAS